MKKTRMKHLLRTIRKSGVSFFAVTFIAATSIAIFLGLQSAATAILKETDRYFRSHRLSSFELMNENGITADDLDAIRQWDGVDEAEGGYATTALMDDEREKITLQVLSLCDELNVPIVLEGELPQQADEVAVEEIFAKRKDIQVGDEIVLEHRGDLKNDTFQVTAIMNQPSFCCANIKDSRGRSAEGLGSAAYYITLAKEAFNTEAYGDRFTKVYVKNYGLDERNYFSEKYREEEAELQEKLQEHGEEWIVSVRNDIGDVRAVETIVEGIYGLSYSMSIIFLLVAIVVCHAAISRMIDEQRTLIGAQKALGFTPGEIRKHYVFYNLLCALLGILIGWGLSVGVVEMLVLAIFIPEFLIGGIALTFVWKQALLVAAICLVIFLAATYAACAKLVQQPAITLLRGEMPAKGRGFFFENWKCYKKLSLYSRSMIKNVLNDRARMVTTIMGVVGCISLLVICFSLKLAIEDSSVLQFGKYFLYQNRLVTDSGVGNAEAFCEALDDSHIDYMAVQDKLKNYRVDGGDWDNAHVIAAGDFEKLKNYMYLEDIETKEYAKAPEHGLLVSRKCAQDNGLSEGSVVELMDSAGNAKEFTVSGVIEHYLPYHMFVTTDAYYEEAMGEPADDCVFLLNGEIDGLYDKVRAMDGFLSLKDNSEFTASAAAINMVIAVCLVLSAVMALLVLLNQTAMHIHQKSRELAVMRINGYTLRETRAYVYKDNIVLTVLGLILGCGFGIGLSYVVVRIIETGANRYVRTPNLPACLYACVVGALFSLGVNLIALRRIKKLNLTNVSGN